MRIKKILFILAATIVSYHTLFAQKKILFILADGFNAGEFWNPYLSVYAAGYSIDICSPMDTIKAASKDRTLDIVRDIALSEAKIDDYAALVIPGGHSPEKLESYPEAVKLVNDFMLTGKPVAAICHGPRLLAKAGLLENRSITGYCGIRDELPAEWMSGRFGTYTDKPVVIDSNLLTSRYPDDVTPFSVAFLDMLDKRTVPDKPILLLVINNKINAIETTIKASFHPIA